MLSRWILRLSMIAVVAAVSSLVTMVSIALAPPRRVPAALTAHLGGSWDAVDATFRDRVGARFPIGSSETDMTTELRREGFSREDWGSSTEEEHVAMRREDNAICHIAAYVRWRADAERHITAIHGIYRNEGCL